MDLKTKVNETVNFLKNHIKNQPKIAIILGSGLGPLADKVQEAVKIDYSKIPNFKVPSVAGHNGQLVMGKLNNVEVIVQQGRWHFYEGHSMNDVVLPVRVYAQLGVEKIIITNAAGGVNLSFEVSDLMIISDQINLMGDNPLKGESAKTFGTQFPDMSNVYDKSMQQILQKVAQENNIKIQKGVYAAMSGPNYETPAEIRMLRTIGADAVGMSTVPESMAANHCGLKVLGISCITNMAAGVLDNTLSHDEIKEAATKAMNNFITLIEKVVVEL